MRDALAYRAALFTHGALAGKLGLGPGAQARHTSALVELMLKGLSAPEPTRAG